MLFTNQYDPDTTILSVTRDCPDTSNPRACVSPRLSFCLVISNGVLINVTFATGSAGSSPAPPCRTQSAAATSTLPPPGMGCEFPRHSTSAAFCPERGFWRPASRFGHVFCAKDLEPILLALAGFVSARYFVRNDPGLSSIFRQRRLLCQRFCAQRTLSVLTRL